MLKKKRWKYLLLLVGFVVVLGLAGAGYVLFVRPDEDGAINDQIATQDTIITNELSRLRQGIADDINKSSASVTTVEQLQALDSSNKEQIALQIISNSYSNGTFERADLFVDYLATLNNSNSIAALTLCLQNSTNQERQATCMSLLKKELVAQKIISADDPIPEVYLSSTTGSEF